MASMSHLLGFPSSMMSSPSMVHRTGDTLVVRSVVSGDQLYKDGTADTSKSEPTTSTTSTKPRDGEEEDELDLPECKIKRNYICTHCKFFTQNPRSFLYHLKDVHKEKIKVYECPHCLYASKHSQKLQRHIHMIHIRGPLRRRYQPRRRVAPSLTATVLKVTPSPTLVPPPPPAYIQQDEQVLTMPQHFVLETQSSPIQDTSKEPEEQEESSYDPLVMDDSEDHDFSEEGSLRIDDVPEGMEDESPPSTDGNHANADGLPEEESGTTGEFFCSLCSFRSTSQVLITRHERVAHLKKKFYRCAKCNYVTHMKARYTKHVKYHSMPMIKCDLCDFRTPYKWNLDRHHKNHEGRGQYKCVACNFTAEIKQSLTVHEMNHHVPPVGHGAVVGAHNQAIAGASTGIRRRNKVGASDTLSKLTEEDLLDQREVALLRLERDSQPTINSSKQEESENPRRKNSISPVKYKTVNKLKIVKKAKNNTHGSLENMTSNSISDSDFIHPDDIVHRSNGSVYIKHLKCQHCPYKAAWRGEIVRHEARVHGIKNTSISGNSFESLLAPRNNTFGRKAPRPIPNLIPIQGKPTPAGKSLLKLSTAQSLLKINNQAGILQNNDNSQQALSERDLNEICAKSCPTSALKDFASLIGGPDAFKIDEPITPPSKSPNTTSQSVSTETEGVNNSNQSFKRKNASFFDKLKEKLLGDAADGGGDAGNLVCSYCGHQSKCLSEQARHQKLHSKANSSSGPQNESDPTPSLSTRCQYCRQRCKTSHDLANHVLTCQAATGRNSTEPPAENSSESSHPMENRVFVWNHMPEQTTNSEEEQQQQQQQQQQPEIDPPHSTEEINGKTTPPTIPSPIVNTPETPLTPPIQESTARSASASPLNTPSGAQPEEESNDNLVGVETAPGYGAVTLKSDDSTHTIKKVFRCPHCSFWASTASRFHVHIVGHLNKKPFECSLCAYRSNWRWDITKHIRLKSARDMSHAYAKVLMTDETGRRNYSKYNKYLAVMKVQEASPADIAAMSNRKLKTSNAGGTPPENNRTQNTSPSIRVNTPNTSPNGSLSNSSKPGQTSNASNSSISVNRVFNSNTPIFPAPPKLIRAPTTVASPSTGVSPLRPPPPLRAAHPQKTPPPPPLRPHLPQQQQSSIPQTNSVPTTKKTLWKCKKCTFKHASREAVLNHVREHYEIKTTISQDGIKDTGTSTAPEPPLTCTICPFTCRVTDEMRLHKDQHTSRPDAIFKCYFCPFYVAQKKDLLQHMTLHGVNEPEDYISKAMQNKTSNNLDDNTHHMGSNKPQQMSQEMADDHSEIPEDIDLPSTNTSENVPPQVMSLMDNFRNTEQQLNELRAFSESQENEEDDENDLQGDEESISDDKTLHFCQYCPARFLSLKAIEMHSRFHQFDFSNKCTSCSYSSRTQEQMMSHSKVHSDTYQEMTDCLAARRPASNLYPRPRTAVVVQGRGVSTPAWVVIAGPPPSPQSSQKEELEKSLFNCPRCPAKFIKQIALKYHISLHGSNGQHKCRHCDYAVKTYGNLIKHELLHLKQSDDSPKSNGITLSNSYSQRSETASTNSNSPNQHSPNQLHVDPQFGNLIHGSPDFVYPTYLKNGRLKEKRFKCHKCPSAFEKRDQYKVHLSLHGANQKYQCEKCDYSVKYYANYVQHIQKHEKCEAAQAEKRDESSEEDIPLNDISTTTHKAIKSMPISIALKSQGNGPLQLSTADKQTLLLLKSRSTAQAAAAGSHREAIDFRRRNIFCPRCPFHHPRRDRVDAHLRGHFAVSRVHHEHRCNSCDFSTNNLIQSREHAKLHFTVPSKAQAEIFAKMDGIELWTDDTLLFQDKGSKVLQDRFLPERKSSSENTLDKVYVDLNGFTVKYEEELDNKINNTPNKDSTNLNEEEEEEEGEGEEEKIALNESEKEEEQNQNENSELIDDNTMNSGLIIDEQLNNKEKIEEELPAPESEEITNPESEEITKKDKESEVPLENKTILKDPSQETTAVETEDSDTNSTSTSSSSVSSNSSSNALQNTNENSSASIPSRPVSRTEQPIASNENYDVNMDN